MSLAVMEMMVVVDNQNAADVLTAGKRFVDPGCLYCVIKYVNVHINLADLRDRKIIRGCVLSEQRKGTFTLSCCF